MIVIMDITILKLSQIGVNLFLVLKNLIFGKQVFVETIIFPET